MILSLDICSFLDKVEDRFLQEVAVAYFVTSAVTFSVSALILVGETAHSPLAAPTPLFRVFTPVSDRVLSDRPTLLGLLPTYLLKTPDRVAEGKRLFSKPTG